MPLSSDERERIAEEERLRFKTQVGTSVGYLKKLGGCFALFLLLLVVGCAALTFGIGR